MTLDETQRYSYLLEKYNNSSEIIELLDLVKKDYDKVIFDRIEKNIDFSNISAMSAGIYNLREMLSKEIK